MLFRLIQLCLLLITSLLCSACTPQYSGKQPPTVVNGEIDLTGWDFEKDGPVRLDGDWLFAWEKFVEPGSWEELQETIPYKVKVPANWVDLEDPKNPTKKLSHSGYGTYAIHLIGVKADSMDFLLRDLRSAAKICILKPSGQKLYLAKKGKPSINSTGEIPVISYDYSFTYSGQIEKIENERGLLLLIHVSNFVDYAKAGLVGSIFVGTPGYYVFKQSSSVIFQAIIIGILLIVSVYALRRFFRLKNDKSLFYYSLFCFMVAIFQLPNGLGQAQGIGLTNKGYEIYRRADYGTIVLMTVSFVLYLKHLLPLPFFKLYARLILLLSIPLLAWTLLTSIQNLSVSLNYYLYFVYISVLGMSIHLIRCAFIKMPNIKWVLSTFLILFIGLMNDTLSEKGIIQTGRIFHFTILAFILLQGYFLSQRSLKLESENDSMTKSLKQNALEKQKLQQRIIKSRKEVESLDKKLIKSKRTEEKYGKLIEDLSREYAATSEQLESAKAEQVQIAKELKEASNQLIQAEKLSGLGAMVSGIAHDINNPLNFIETARFQEQEKLDQLKEHLLGLVPEGEEGEEFKADLLARFEKLGKLNDQIKTGVTRVTEISKSMRNASRADTEKTADVNLVEVIEESLIITGNKVKQFQLINNIPDGIALATCNRSQIGQVVMNFLSNAADALIEYKEQYKDHKGIIQVDLAINNQSDGKNQDQNQPKIVQISISDNGSGVPQENRDKVLNAFYTTKEAGVGTGLGLAIAGKVAQAHDGTIYIEDGLPNDQGGHGARFTLEFRS